MITLADKVRVDDFWLAVGGNTPWGSSVGDTIIRIEVHQEDPRNTCGAESSFIIISFKDRSVLEIKTNNYMIYYREESE